jgi:glycosyltransferase involved in cell wall biosynthesis
MKQIEVKAAGSSRETEHSGKQDRAGKNMKPVQRELAEQSETAVKKKRAQKILILGTVPPPTGGVTIHVSRLLQHLEARGIAYSFCSISDGPASILRKVMKHKVIHLHASNSYFRFGFSLICFLTGKKLIQTVHGDLGRFSPLRNFCDRVAVFLSHTPVVINKGSLEKAGKINRRAVLISAFIKPLNPESLPEEILAGLNRWKKGFSHIFCANATGPDRDTLGREIYGGSELMKVFGRQPGKGLIFADPGGHYREIIRGSNGGVPDNVFYIDSTHSFFEILKLADCYIRATTTDGDSLSVKEALSIGKPVIASDCVDRPAGCTLFRTADTEDLLRLVTKFKGMDHKGESYPNEAYQDGIRPDGAPPRTQVLEEVDRIVQLYEKCR